MPVVDLAAIRADTAERYASVQDPGGPFGSLRVAHPFYASTDWAIARCIHGEHAADLGEPRRGEWAAYLAGCQQAGDGSFPLFRDHSPLHANGMAVGALGWLGGRNRHPVRLYEPFATPERIAPWLDTAIDWSRQWSASHLFWGGMHCFALSQRATPAWREAAFTWLDAELDPATGWWRRGVAHADRHEPLGGSVHILPIYQHLGRPFPYPERLIDSVLALQLPDGHFHAHAPHGLTYLDLDALYALDYARSLAPKHRPDAIAACARRLGDLVARSHAAPRGMGGAPARTPSRPRRPRPVPALRSGALPRRPRLDRHLQRPAAVPHLLGGVRRASNQRSRLKRLSTMAGARGGRPQPRCGHLACIRRTASLA